MATSFCADGYTIREQRGIDKQITQIKGCAVISYY